jgi:hypothetical protein
MTTFQIVQVYGGWRVISKRTRTSVFRETFATKALALACVHANYEGVEIETP